MLHTSVRRLFKTAIVGALAALVYAWFRDRGSDPEPAPRGTADWPPLDIASASEVLPAMEPEPAAVGAQQKPIAARAPEKAPLPTPSHKSAGRWVGSDVNGDCSADYPIKAKDRSGIYHPPDGLLYARTNADRCYLSAEAAESDGYRVSKR